MTATVPSHPYYPVDAVLPHYVPNETPLPKLLTALAASVSSVVVVTVLVVRRLRPKITVPEQLIVAWFALCGFLHCVFEAHAVWNFRRLASMQTLFAQLMKEYALSDSRYLTSDSFVVTIEAITVVVWGPLCWAVIIAIAQLNPIRHPLQIIVSVGHLYGVTLYYATSLTDLYVNGVAHSRPEFLYFWVYFIGCNVPWVVVPAILLYQSVVHFLNASGNRRVKAT